MSEQCTHFLQVFSQNTVSLTFCQPGGKLFPFSDTVTVCNIRMMFRTMPSFIFLYTPDSRFPTSVFPHYPVHAGKLSSWPSPTNGGNDLRSFTVIIRHLLPELTMKSPVPVSSSPASLKSNSISVMFPQLSSTTTMKFCASSHSEV